MAKSISDRKKKKKRRAMRERETERGHERDVRSPSARLYI